MQAKHTEVWGSSMNADLCVWACTFLGPMWLYGQPL